MSTIEEEIRDRLISIDGNISSMQQINQTISNNTAFTLLVNQTGFANIAQGIAAQISVQLQTNELLALNANQNQAIICWLQKIAEMNCSLVKLSESQNEISLDSNSDIKRILQIVERVHPSEVLEINKLSEIENKLKACCPDEEPETKPCFEPCNNIELPDIKPVRIKWKPVKFDNPKDSSK